MTLLTVILASSQPTRRQRTRSRPPNRYTHPDPKILHYSYWCGLVQAQSRYWSFFCRSQSKRCAQKFSLFYRHGVLSVWMWVFSTSSSPFHVFSYWKRSPNHQRCTLGHSVNQNIRQASNKSETTPCSTLLFVRDLLEVSFGNPE